MERDDLTYAGFWVRLWACIIDSVLAVMVIVLMTLMYGASRSKTATTNRLESTQAARVATSGVGAAGAIPEFLGSSTSTGEQIIEALGAGQPGGITSVVSEE